MARLFGTDGIRGKANTAPVTPEIMLQLGKALCQHFKDNGKDKIKVLIGKDTRLSGYMLETALTSGLSSMGATVYLVGPLPTPAIAHLTKSMSADLGLMITASHNPACDNGLKIFDRNGYKLSNEAEDLIEKYVFDDSSKMYSEEIGKVHRIDDAAGRYIEFVKSTINNYDLSGLKVVLDCANGGAYKLAPIILKELGVELIKIGTHPDGKNINLNCGALFPDLLAQKVLEQQADCGIALDGDADRLVIVDELGNKMHGDCLTAVFAYDLHKKGLLKNNKIAVTTMTNTGFFMASKERDIELELTDVGDRYLIEAMKKHDISIGGEESGHIIFKDFATTGDGTLSALKLLEILKEQKLKCSELSKTITVFPSQLYNHLTNSKPPLEDLRHIQATNKDFQASIGQEGKSLIRYSGTENKLRILVEAKDESTVTEWIEKFKDASNKDFA